VVGASVKTASPVPPDFPARPRGQHLATRDRVADDPAEPASRPSIAAAPWSGDDSGENAWRHPNETEASSIAHEERRQKSRMFSVFDRPPGLAQHLASEIEELIVARGLRSGDRIATMEELREQSGFGRATIGETARLLTERGTVEVRPGRGGGLFVAEGSAVVQLRQTLLTVPQGATTVAHAIAVRDALEELIALDAAEHRTEADIRDLEVHLDAMRRSVDDLAAFLHANWSLHERIADITPNQLARAMYVGMMRCIAELSVRADAGASALTPSDYLTGRLAVHADLVAAIRLGDSDRVKAAAAAHRGDGAPAIADGAAGTPRRSRNRASGDSPHR
jgi:GntR family transcriptional regulator, transcriptional repressor for pyruvate dehydrogenase complex